MPDAYTGTGQSSLDQAAYDLAVYYALRPMLYYDAVADVQSTNHAPAQGVSCVFTIETDLAVATATLDQSTDVDAVAMSDSQVTVTLLEKGNAVITTYALRATTYVPFNPVAANVIGFNAGRSQDRIAQAQLEAGSNVRYATGGSTDPTSRATVDPTDTLVANDVRRARADLVGANVAPIGNYYAAFIHPDVSYDFRGETGAAAWRDPHTYSQPNEIWTGEMGMFEQFRFVETPTAPLFPDSGSSTTLTDVYGTLFMGRQALAKAYSTAEGRGPTPSVITGPVTDKLRRLGTVGWHWFGNYGRFREAALRRVESASTIGANT